MDTPRYKMMLGYLTEISQINIYYSISHTHSLGHDNVHKRNKSSATAEGLHDMSCAHLYYMKNYKKNYSKKAKLSTVFHTFDYGRNLVIFVQTS